MIPEKPRYINAGGKLIDLSVPKIMGILNITPDSFYAGSRYSTEEEIVGAAAVMLQDRTDILDVGGTLRVPVLKISQLKRKARVFSKQ